MKTGRFNNIFFQLQQEISPRPEYNYLELEYAAGAFPLLGLLLSAQCFT